jgi:hypothetical protein
MYLVIIILAIFFFILLKKQKSLENEIKELKKFTGFNKKSDSIETNAVVSESAIQNLSEQDIQNSFATIKTELEQVKEDDIGQKFAAWLRDDWLMKIGGLLLLLAIGWFVSYAFMNNWIGPIGRISLGILFGATLMALGEIRTKKSLDQGLTLLLIGAIAVSLTIYSARELYDFFTPLSALAIIFLIFSLVSFSSIIHKKSWLAISALILGGIAPLLVASAQPSMSGLFSYLLILSVAILWIIYYTNWRILAPIAFAIIFIYNLTYVFSYLDQLEKLTALIFAFIFSLLFYLANLLLIYLNKEIEKSDLVLAVLNAMLLIIWISISAGDELKSFLSIAVALFFAGGAFIAYHFTRIKEPVYLYSAIALVFLASATAFELQGPALTIAFIIEAGILILLTAIFSKNKRDTDYVSLTMIPPILLSLASFDQRHWQKSVIQEHFFVLLTLFLVLAVLFFYFKRFLSIPEKSHPLLMKTSGLLSLAFFFALVWRSLEVSLTNIDTAHMLALFLYTIFGLAFYIIGSNRDLKEWRNTGAIILGFVIIRLILVEAWQMDTPGRIITFSTIATLLIATAIIRKNNNKSQ